MHQPGQKGFFSQAGNPFLNQQPTGEGHADGMFPKESFLQAGGGFASVVQIARGTGDHQAADGIESEHDDGFSEGLHFAAAGIHGAVGDLENSRRHGLVVGDDLLKLLS